MVRGDVYAIELPRGRGRTQHGARFGVIVQADDLLRLSTAVICPTSTFAPIASFHPAVEIEGQETLVLCEMLGAVDMERLGRRAGHLTFSEMRSVEEGIELVLDLG